MATDSVPWYSKPEDFDQRAVQNIHRHTGRSSIWNCKNNVLKTPTRAVSHCAQLQGLAFQLQLGQFRQSYRRQEKEPFHLQPAGEMGQ